MKRVELETAISQYPVCQYGFLDSGQVIFSEQVRYICESECDRYGKSWSCPPAVGTVAECRKRCLAYDRVLVFTSLAQVADTALLKETLDTRKGHEEITRGICQELAAKGEDFLALSSESCNICGSCTYPEETCRYREKMLPCIESFGILVTDSAERCNIDFFYDSTTVTWFGMIFFHSQEK